MPHARTQSVRVTQGPWQRSLGLASMHVDSTPGAVKITGHHRDAVEARRLAQEQAARQAAEADLVLHREAAHAERSRLEAAQAQLVAELAQARAAVHDAWVTIEQARAATGTAVSSS